MTSMRIFCAFNQEPLFALKNVKKYHLESISYELHVEKQKALYPFSSEI